MKIRKTLDTGVEITVMMLSNTVVFINKLQLFYQKSNIEIDWELEITSRKMQCNC